MLACDVCGATAFRAEMITEVFEIDGRRVLVEHIPAQLCVQCGEVVFSQEIMERVRRMVHGEAEPVGLAQLEVFAFA